MKYLIIVIVITIIYIINNNILSFTNINEIDPDSIIWVDVEKDNYLVGKGFQSQQYENNEYENNEYENNDDDEDDEDDEDYDEDEDDDDDDRRFLDKDCKSKDLKKLKKLNKKKCNKLRKKKDCPVEFDQETKKCIEVPEITNSPLIAGTTHTPTGIPTFHPTEHPVIIECTEFHKKKQCKSKKAKKLGCKWDKQSFCIFGCETLKGKKKCLKQTGCEFIDNKCTNTLHPTLSPRTNVPTRSPIESVSPTLPLSHSPSLSPTTYPTFIPTKNPTLPDLIKRIEVNFFDECISNYPNLTYCGGIDGSTSDDVEEDHPYRGTVYRNGTWYFRDRLKVAIFRAGNDSYILAEVTFGHDPMRDERTFNYAVEVEVETNGTFVIDRESWRKYERINGHNVHCSEFGDPDDLLGGKYEALIEKLLSNDMSLFIPTARFFFEDDDEDYKNQNVDGMNSTLVTGNTTVEVPKTLMNEALKEQHNITLADLEAVYPNKTLSENSTFILALTNGSVPEYLIEVIPENQKDQNFPLNFYDNLHGLHENECHNLFTHPNISGYHRLISRYDLHEEYFLNHNENTTINGEVFESIISTNNTNITELISNINQTTGEGTSTSFRRLNEIHDVLKYDLQDSQGRLEYLIELHEELGGYDNDDIFGELDNFDKVDTVFDLFTDTFIDNNEETEESFLNRILKQTKENINGNKRFLSPEDQLLKDQISYLIDKIDEEDDEKMDQIRIEIENNGPEARLLMEKYSSTQVAMSFISHKISRDYSRMLAKYDPKSCAATSDEAVGASNSGIGVTLYKVLWTILKVAYQYAVIPAMGKMKQYKDAGGIKDAYGTTNINQLLNLMFTKLFDLVISKIHAYDETLALKQVLQFNLAFSSQINTKNTLLDGRTGTTISNNNAIVDKMVNYLRPLMQKSSSFQPPQARVDFADKIALTIFIIENISLAALVLGIFFSLAAYYNCRLKNLDKLFKDMKTAYLIITVVLKIMERLPYIGPIIKFASTFLNLTVKNPLNKLEAFFSRAAGNNVDSKITTYNYLSGIMTGIQNWIILADFLLTFTMLIPCLLVPTSQSTLVTGRRLYNEIFDMDEDKVKFWENKQEVEKNKFLKLLEIKEKELNNNNNNNNNNLRGNNNDDNINYDINHYQNEIEKNKNDLNNIRKLKTDINNNAKNLKELKFDNIINIDTIKHNDERKLNGAHNYNVQLQQILNNGILDINNNNIQSLLNKVNYVKNIVSTIPLRTITDKLDWVTTKAAPLISFVNLIGPVLTPIQNLLRDTRTIWVPRLCWYRVYFTFPYPCGVNFCCCDHCCCGWFRHCWRSCWPCGVRWCTGTSYYWAAYYCPYPLTFTIQALLDKILMGLSFIMKPFEIIVQAAINALNIPALLPPIPGFPSVAQLAILDNFDISSWAFLNNAPNYFGTMPWQSLFDIKIQNLNGLFQNVNVDIQTLTGSITGLGPTYVQQVFNAIPVSGRRNLDTFSEITNTDLTKYSKSILKTTTNVFKDEKEINDDRNLGYSLFRPLGDLGVQMTFADNIASAGSTKIEDLYVLSCKEWCRVNHPTFRAPCEHGCVSGGNYVTVGTADMTAADAISAQTACAATYPLETNIGNGPCSNTCDSTDRPSGTCTIAATGNCCYKGSQQVGKNYRACLDGIMFFRGQGKPKSAASIDCVVSG